MTQQGRVDYEAVALAQARLLSSRRLSTHELVAAYRVVRTAAPRAYTEEFVTALILQGYKSGDEWGGSPGRLDRGG